MPPHNLPSFSTYLQQGTELYYRLAALPASHISLPIFFHPILASASQRTLLTQVSPGEVQEKHDEYLGLDPYLHHPCW